MPSDAHVKADMDAVPDDGEVECALAKMVEVSID